MSGLVFFIWIPTENFEKLERNKKILKEKQNVTDIEQFAWDEETATANKEVKKSNSQDTFAISIETDSLMEDKKSENLQENEVKSTSQQNLAELQNLLPKSVPTTIKPIQDYQNNFDEYQPMEKIMRDIFDWLKISSCTWMKSDSGNFYQITFSIEAEKFDDVIHLLNEGRIGQRDGSSISIIPCNLHYESPLENKEQSEEEQSGTPKSSAWDNFISSVRARLTVARIVQEVKSDATLTFDYVCLLIVASILAAFGLIEDNTLFLAASMLISPLMGPIIAATFGTVIKDKNLQFVGIKNELIGLALVTFVGFIFAIVLCIIGDIGPTLKVSTEMMNRGTAHSIVVGIFIALPSGAAVAIAILGENVGSLVGVAISASLLPPAVNAGLMWGFSVIIMCFKTPIVKSAVQSALYSENEAIEMAVMGLMSMCVTITNIFCIYVVGVIFLKIKEVAPSVSHTHRQFWKHDIKIARDYNKCNHHNHEDPEVRFMDDIVEHETMNFKGIDPDYLKYNHTWSPMNLRHRRDSFSIKTTLKDLDAFYRMNKIHERMGVSGINTSPNNDTVITNRSGIRNKWPTHDTWYTSTKHPNDYLKPGSAPLEKIEEMKNIFEKENIGGQPDEGSITGSGNGANQKEVKRKFIVTLADDPLKKA